MMRAGAGGYTDKGPLAGGGAVFIKGTQREEKCDNKEIGRSGYTDEKAISGRRIATIKRAGAGAILIEGPQRRTHSYPPTQASPNTLLPHHQATTHHESTYEASPTLESANQPASQPASLPASARRMCGQTAETHR